MPLLLTVPILLNFEKSFIIFHKLLFRNDYWIFNPDLDPVINILPEEFFSLWNDDFNINFVSKYSTVCNV